MKPGNDQINANQGKHYDEKAEYGQPCGFAPLPSAGQT
jgi:hypothetical protein